MNTINVQTIIDAQSIMNQYHNQESQFDRQNPQSLINEDSRFRFPIAVGNGFHKEKPHGDQQVNVLKIKAEIGDKINFFMDSSSDNFQNPVMLYNIPNKCEGGNAILDGLKGDSVSKTVVPILNPALFPPEKQPFWFFQGQVIKEHGIETFNLQFAIYKRETADNSGKETLTVQGYYEVSITLAIGDVC